MEKIPAGFRQEKDPSTLTGKEKVEVILGLFGSNVARERFLELCRNYTNERSTLPEGDSGENYRPTGRKYSPPKRATIHNGIMEILSRIAVESKNLTPLQRTILNEFYSRENAGKFIREYVLANEGGDAEEETPRAKGGATQGHSGPAHFHSLGKEH